MKKTLDWNTYLDTASRTVSEGIVMLTNENHALPLAKDEEVAVFGRIQLHYYKSGTGSGGMVNVSRVISIVDGLTENNVKINETLLNTYKEWEKEHPYELGEGWAAEPWSQKEMPLSDKLVADVAKETSTAIVIIGRTAGEEQDNFDGEGSFRLTELEWDMLKKVRKSFSKVILLLNVSNIIDMSFLDTCPPDACLYVWAGGMVGGRGTADVLCGKVAPSGKLPDTIAYHLSDYPSSPYFGGKTQNFYSEDIYVGYRYFETFAREKVRFPFGFGLSYTEFDISVVRTSEGNGAAVSKDTVLTFDINVRNTGFVAGKETVQLYCEAPQGKLGKAARVLCGFEKTKLLAPGEEQLLTVTVPVKSLASYDDSGVTGHRFSYVLEAGTYHFYVGNNVRNAALSLGVSISDTVVTEQLTQALAPVKAFRRFKPVVNDKAAGSYEITTEDVPLNEVDEPERRLSLLPAEIPYTGDLGIKLADVLKGTHSMDEFIGQLSDEDLSCIIRGEGMGSPKVTPGTAAAFGGVAKSLTEFGIPCGCCDDGPSGMRLDCGTKAFSLPIGTMIAATFNKELVEELFVCMGLEMITNKVDCLLGPGMNIHRHPLNGRNFEYFSEDPLLTGQMATAELKGLHSVGVTGTIKHFCGNNQETGRHFVDNIASERALREIYLKGFEIAVKEGNADSIMTTYGPVNGLWTAGNFDLNTVILRNEWGFTGFTMTDWWADINERGTSQNKTNFAAMAKAQNDIFMVCADGEKNDDNTLESLKNGTLLRAELQRNAKNICRFLLHTPAMNRLLDEPDEITIVNRPAEDTPSDEPVIFYDVYDDDFTLPLEDICTDRGTSYSFGLKVHNPSYYKVTLTASSTQGELAQIPVTLFSLGSASGTFTWNGTDGKPVSYEKEIPMFSPFTSIRLFFAQSGLKMLSIRFDRVEKDIPWSEL